MRATVNIVGAGKVAISLARLWHCTATVNVGSIVNQSQRSAANAVRLIGAGKACSSMAELRPADLLLIGVKDSDIFPTANLLSEYRAVKPGGIAFHLSGGLAADQLSPLREKSAVACASLHLMKSFESPALAPDALATTWCTVEGDDVACRQLSELMSQHTAGVARVRDGTKLTYHAASVFACNYLVSLVEIAIRLLATSGIPHDQARSMIGPLVAGTASNLMRLPPAEALTGPVARADVKLVRKQLEAIQHATPELASLYCELGRIATDLAREKGAYDSNLYDQLDELFSASPAD